MPNLRDDSQLPPAATILSGSRRFNSPRLLLEQDVALVTGTSVGRYQIQSPLGAGGMGEVYLARDPLLNRTVAVKLLPTAFARDPDRLRRFEQEAQASAALNHPRILAVHDVGRLGDQPFIVMEYVRGETLGAYMRRERPSLSRALDIGIEIANALDAAHRARIIHRDLKPGNVMVTDDGHVKVVDFGLAKFLQDDTSAPTVGGPVRTETISGQLLGTPGYMSPEQLLGDQVDERTDIYSLGVILFELVTGRRPYEGDVMELLRQAAQTTPVRTVRDVDQTVAPEISETIARCMARDAASRFQTAGALETELRRFRVEGPTPYIDVRPATGSQPVSARTQRRRIYRFAPWLLAGVAAIGALVSIPLVDRLGFGDLARAQRPVIAVLPFANLTGDESKQYLGIGIAYTLITSLARLSSISVVPPSSMLEPGASKRSFDEVARDFGATMLVSGSVQFDGERLRISAQLSTPDGRPVVWTGDVAARPDELFSMQNQLAESLIAALRITVTDVERQRLTRVPTKDGQALDAYLHGLALMDRPDTANLDSAVANFTAATARDPSFALAFAALGEAYRRRAVSNNDAALMAKATTAVEEALRLDKDQLEVALSLAKLYRSTGQPGPAVEAVRRVLAVQPENDDAHRLLGQLLASADSQAALKEFQKAVELRPQHWRNYDALGMFWYGQGKPREAIDAFREVAKLKPRDATPLQQIGAMYLALNELDRAAENFKKSNDVQPNAGAYSNLGTIAYVKRRYEEAIRAYQDAIKLEPASAVHHGNLGDAFRKMGRVDDARAAYRSAIKYADAAWKLNPSDAKVVSQLGLYYAKTGLREDAERWAQVAERMSPTSPEILYQRAAVLALVGNPDDAVKQLSEAIAKGASPQAALDDDDFQSLRSLPAFRKLAVAAKTR